MRTSHLLAFVPGAIAAGLTVFGAPPALAQIENGLPPTEQP